MRVHTLQTMLALVAAVILASCDARADARSPAHVTQASYAWGYVPTFGAPDAGYPLGTFFVDLSTNRTWLMTQNGWLYLGSFVSCPPLRCDSLP